MPQEMSFAQALNEARQIIVQQSNRIKGDLDRIKALQETINSQTATIADADRTAKQKASELDAAHEQVKALTAKAEEARVAKEQGEAVIDRQGQRLTQMQETIADLEKQIAEHTQKSQQLSRELDSVRAVVPTQEDTDALAALTSLLSAKKGASAPPVKAPEEGAAAA
jgi:predicted  nucleic acid-binding Zn-ribbon protein